MSAKIPNIYDRDIAEMVRRNHTPREFWTTQGTLQMVHCVTCFSEWPCPTNRGASRA